MSLKEQLDKFNNQKVKCQSLVSSIASSRERTLPPSRSFVPSASSRGKFSDNTEQLQLINSIRKAPVGSQMKRVIDLLYEVCVSSSSYELYIS